MLRIRSFGALAVLAAFAIAPIAYADVQSALPSTSKWLCMAPDGTPVSSNTREDIVFADCVNAVNRTKLNHKIIGAGYEIRYIKPPETEPVTPAPAPPTPAPVTPPVTPPPATPPPPAPVPPVVQQPIRINVGGGAYTDSAGNVWAADTGVNGIPDLQTGVVVTNTKDPGLFLDFRYDFTADPEITYAIKVANGAYRVDLFSSEMYFVDARAGAGQRKFGVKAEGQLMVTGWDLYAEAGARQAVSKSIQVTVADGELNLEFVHETENPTIAAIAVYPAASAPALPTAPTPPTLVVPPPPVTPPVPAPATGSAKLSWVAPTTNTDGSTLSDLSGYEVLYGTQSPTIVIDAPGAITSYEVNNLPAGTWKFAVRARNSAGTLSALSAIGTKTIP